MKRIRTLTTLALSALLITFSAVATSYATPQHQGEHQSKHGLSVKEYEDFHSVLHPLQHDALPKKDFARIRAQSALLVKRGKAVVKLGLPKGTSDEHKEEFTNGLTKFSAALAKFKADAKKGTDEQLNASYGAVHDSFEMLAALLPRG